MPTRTNQTTQAGQGELVAQLVDCFMAAVYACERDQSRRPQWSRYAGIDDAAAAAAFDVETQALMRSSRPLRQALGRACRREDGPANAPARAHLLELLEHELVANRTHALYSYRALLGMAGETARADTVAAAPPAPTPPTANGSRRRAAPARKARRTIRGVRRVLLPLVLLNTIIFGVMAVGPVLHLLVDSDLPEGSPLVLALSGFVIWALSFIPGWLLVRFLDRRAGALWAEYVIHLHRLGLDRPRDLPEPPKTSSYYASWRDDGGLNRRGQRTLYQEKFDAYYGKSVSRFGIDDDRPVRPEALFPVFLCTAVLAVGWTAILYEPSRSLAASEAGWAILSFAFAGAYLYFVQTLMRRYFQADLRAGAYVSGYVRILAALIIAGVLQVTLLGALGTPVEVAVAIAFVVGWFPDVGLQWLLRTASRRLRSAVPSVVPDFPLNRLDGLNTWYETRLLEEGIEDLQNMATAKTVDVLLHTRVPVDRYVDWLDQAVLLIHMPPEPAALTKDGLRYKSRARQAAREADKHERRTLRRCGIRTATGLLRALHPDRDPGERERLLRYLESHGVPRASLESLYAVLVAEPRIAIVLNWQEGEISARTSVRPGPLPTAG